MFMNTFENKSGATHVMLFVRVYGELSSKNSTHKAWGGEVKNKKSIY